MNSLHTQTLSADTEAGSFLSGCWTLTRGELAACTLLFLGIPSLLLLTSRWNGNSPAQEIRVISVSGNSISSLIPSSNSACLDLNLATARELELLPGIGPARSRKIVEYRSTHGPFKTTSELQNVSGLPPALVKRLEPMLVVKPQ